MFNLVWRPNTCDVMRSTHAPIRSLLLTFLFFVSIFFFFFFYFILIRLHLISYSALDNSVAFLLPVLLLLGPQMSGSLLLPTLFLRFKIATCTVGLIGLSCCYMWPSNLAPMGSKLIHCWCRISSFLVLWPIRISGPTGTRSNGVWKMNSFRDSNEFRHR